MFSFLRSCWRNLKLLIMMNTMQWYIAFWELLYSESLTTAAHRRKYVQILLEKTWANVRAIVGYTIYELRQPLAREASERGERLLEGHKSAASNGTVDSDDVNQTKIQLAHVILGSTRDSLTVKDIPQHCRRMALYQAVGRGYYICCGFRARDVKILLSAGVPVICISYKHTRYTDKEENVRIGLQRDRGRVHCAVDNFARELSLSRLLFWCDIVDTRDDDMSWAEQGVNPYLCIPTLRLVSQDLQEEIDQSFWMNVELCAARFRGGMMTSNEDTGKLVAWTNHAEPFAIAQYILPLEAGQISISKLIVNPRLYYHKARFEKDKPIVMLLALKNIALKGYRKFSQNTKFDRIPIELESDDDFYPFFELTLVDGVFSFDSVARVVKRPEREVHKQWKGGEEFFPAMTMIRQCYVDMFNEELGRECLEIRLNGTDEDGTTRILARPRGIPTWCCTLRLRVAGFAEFDSHVIGKVLSYRVASQEEEESMNHGENTSKRVYFI